MTEFLKNQKKEFFHYCKIKNIKSFQKDINESGAKIFIADSYENIFNSIKNNSKSHLYEYWDTYQPIKLFIDYDRKTENDIKLQNDTDTDTDKNDTDTFNQNDTLNQNENKLGTCATFHKNEILNIINEVKSMIPGITDVYILKSIPNHEKKSYHIIFDGIHFGNRSNIKKFMEDQLKPKFKDLFDNKIIDVKVYGDLCFRTLLSTKYGQNRYLYLLNTSTFLSELKEEPISKEHTTFDLFLKTMISNIEGTELFVYKPEKKKNNSKKIHLMNDEDIYSDKEIIRKYLDILDPERYNDYNKWINIGFMLYSINNDYIDLWRYFSSKSEKYNEELCNSKWNSFATNEYIYTVNNIIHLAHTDNPDDCKEISKEIPNHDIRFLRPFDNILSKLIHRLYSHKFICSNPEKKEWYFFNGIRWKKENKNFNLRKLIIDDVFQKVENYRRQLIKERADEDIIKNYHNILLKLGSGIQLNCLELEFYNSNFYKMIDQNKDLLGFENGIFDLTTMTFRQGTSSDYISLSTGYEYNVYSKNDPIYKELVSLIEKILPIESVRHFTLKALASCLDGHTRDENFYILTGLRGANGKSTITDLLLKTLGDYASISPVSLITGKRESANSANSALFNIQNKRAIIMQEPSANEVIQADVMKSLTGGDRISTRELNSSQVEFKPNCKFFMCCNRLPMLSESDGGTARRLKLIEFISRFVEEPNENALYEYQIDKELKNKLDDYKMVFMSILLDYYFIYKKEGIKPPEEVLQVTRKYENNNNNIKTFIDENIIYGNKTDFIIKQELKDMYKTDFNLKSCFPNFNLFLNQLELAIGTEIKMDKNKVPKLYGFYIRQPHQETEDEM